LTDSAASKQREKFTLHKPSPASSTSRRRRLLASGKQLESVNKSPRSSVGKRQPSSAVSPASDVVNRHGAESPLTRSTSSASLQCPLRSPRRTVNDTSTFSIAADSCDFSPTKASQVGHGSPDITRRSPKVSSRSPKVTSRSPKARTPEFSRSPRQRQLLNGSSVAVKRGQSSSPDGQSLQLLSAEGPPLLQLLTPEGQPRTKKFIVERLRNAKTSRRNIATGNKSSLNRKSPQQKVTGKCFNSFLTVIIV